MPQRGKTYEKILALAIVVLSFVAAPAAVRTQEKQPPPQFKMVEFHMALLKRGPQWSASGMTKEVQAAHVAYVMSLLDSGRAIISGPLVTASQGIAFGPGGVPEPFNYGTLRSTNLQVGGDGNFVGDTANANTPTDNKVFFGHALYDITENTNAFL
ncbi:MAG: hypothetical protein ABR555_20120, partial [Pyrinomonadaceae bacterium]